MCMKYWSSLKDCCTNNNDNSDNNIGNNNMESAYIIAQKMKFSIKDFFNKRDHIWIISGHICWRNP